MDFYKEINIDNLDEIRAGIMERIPDMLLSSTNLTYIDDNKKIFLGVKALREFLEPRKLHYSVGQVAVNITMPGEEGSYHVDNGPFKHSINIPITDCTGSWINFFETSAEPHQVAVVNNGESHNFSRFHKEDCKLIHRAETTEPYILGVKTPHQVQNLSDKTRIMLLLRMYPNENLAKL